MVRKVTRNINNKQEKKPKGTIHQKHVDTLEKFEEEYNTLPDKKNVLDDLQRKLNKINSKNPKDHDINDIRESSRLKTEIEKLSYEIYKIENRIDYLDYVSSTMDIISDYSNGRMSKVVLESAPLKNMKVKSPTSKKMNIMNFFEEKNMNNDEEESIDNVKMHEYYMSIIDPTYNGVMNIRINNLCEDCGGEKTYFQSDGASVCTNCGLTEYQMINTENPKYNDPIQDSGTYAYKRINHMTEILSQLQAKESTDIPIEVIDRIKMEIKKRRISENDLDIFGLRKILKGLKLRKYYEHGSYILQRINGKEPPSFSRETEQKIKQMFRDIQKPFELYCPKERKNFLNYSYVLHKFCQLLGLNDFLSYFPLLKNNSKLLQHDKIWKNICDHLKWPYHRSI